MKNAARLGKCGLMLAPKYGIVCHMGEMRKITANLPADLLASAQAHTGEGVTETLRQALQVLARDRLYQGLMDLRGKLNFDDFDLEELREDREFDEKGNVIN
jgi:hypothetical protein